MAWNDRGANDFVTGNDINDAIALARVEKQVAGNIPVGNDFVTKAQVLGNLNVAPIAGNGSDYPHKALIKGVTSITMINEEVTAGQDSNLQIKVYRNGAQVIEETMFYEETRHFYVQVGDVVSCEGFSAPELPWSAGTKQFLEITGRTTRESSSMGTGHLVESFVVTNVYPLTIKCYTKIPTVPVQVTCSPTLRDVNPETDTAFFVGNQSGNIAYDWYCNDTNYYIEVIYAGVVVDSFYNKNIGLSGSRSFEWVYNGSDQNVYVRYTYVEAPPEAPPVVNSGETISCGVATEYKGGQAFPTEIAIQLGSATGIVSFEYDSKNLPDKFEIWVGGVKVLDTGYRGQPQWQSDLNSMLDDMGLPRETIKGGPIGSDSFNKTTNHAYAIVKVYGPLGGTAWTFKLGCPYYLGRPPIIL